MTYSDALSFLNGRMLRRCPGFPDTFLVNRLEKRQPVMVVCLGDTDIIKFYPNGMVSVFTGRNYSSLIKTRINEFLPMGSPHLNEDQGVLKWSSRYINFKDGDSLVKVQSTWNIYRSDGTPAFTTPTNLAPTDTA